MEKTDQFRGCAPRSGRKGREQEKLEATKLLEKSDRTHKSACMIAETLEHILTFGGRISRSHRRYNIFVSLSHEALIVERRETI